MAFCHFLERKQDGAPPYFSSHFFGCSGLEQTLLTPIQSILIKKDKIFLKIVFLNFLEKRGTGPLHIFFSLFLMF